MTPALRQGSAKLVTVEENRLIRLDSEHFDCIWHMIEVHLISSNDDADHRICLSAFADNREALPNAVVACCPSVADRQADDPNTTWQSLELFIRPTRLIKPECPDEEPDEKDEEVVPWWHREPKKKPSRPDIARRVLRVPHGRYLWLNVHVSRLENTHRKGECADQGPKWTLEIRVTYPRQSWLDEMPGVFRQDPIAAAFLEHFLATLQVEWEDIEAALLYYRSDLDPRTVRSQKALQYLSAWIGEDVSADWPLSRQRRFLATAVAHAQNRGSLQAAKAMLQAALHGISGVPVESIPAFPQFIEGFRERRTALLDDQYHASLSDAEPLALPDLADAVRLDEGRREGEVRLVSQHRPSQRIEDRHANRLRVFVPAALFQTRRDRRHFQSIMSREVPAHLNVDLRLISPVMRLGEQSTLGVDTILGEEPRSRLAVPQMLRASGFAETGLRRGSVDDSPRERA